MTEKQLWQQAASFAARAHHGQMRRDGKTPYVAHPLRVAMTVRHVFGCEDEVCLAAAMLHGLIQRLSPRIHYLEASVTPSNEASTRTFRKIARDLNTSVTEEVLFPGNRFHGPSHEDEVLFRIGPFSPQQVAEYAQQAAANGNRNLVIES